MNMDHVQRVVDAVLYEGYILYPYRPTSAKNRQRWTFGGIYPRTWRDATDGADPCRMQTQCLVEGGAATRLEIRVRFLHPVARELGALGEPLASWPDEREPELEPVSTLALGDRLLVSWQEAMERDVELPELALGELTAGPRRVPFAFAGRRDLEPLEDDAGLVRGALVHRQLDVAGHVELGAERVADGAYRVRVRIENETPMAPSAATDREEASLCSFASTHTILGARDGAFVSLMDPPARLAEAAAACENEGAYPVLVGPDAARDTVLSSPIILYDHPEVAPESPGDYFDATEIDELLSLRILAMTPAEKREMAATDPRAAALLERTEALDGDDFMRLHGTLREPRSGPDGGRTTLRVGDRVRLRPKPGGDVIDLVLDGRTAVVEAVEHDFEDRVHVAVAVDDDPGREWGFERMPGHRFFFSPDEIEAVAHEPRDSEASA